MLLTGRQPHGKIRDVAGFDTDHLHPFGIAEIRQGLCLLDPRIPDNRREGVLLGNADATAEEMIFQLNCALGVQVNAVSDTITIGPC